MSGRTATGAQPMPADGRRALSGAEAQQRARAMACMREKGSECQGQVHVGIYFDGTGNNREWEGTFVTGKTRSTKTQLARNGHSNVARLYDAALKERGNGFFSIYVPGVGTPFADVGDTNQEGDTLGGGAARYGADRIHWAILQVINSVHQYLNGSDLIQPNEAKVLVASMSETRLLEGMTRRAMLTAIAQRLERVVKGHQRRVKSVHVSVFGFSRGAAQARAFVHRLYETAEAWGSGCGYNIAGIPLYLNFMGIFDTVASVGVAAMSRVSKGKWDWAAGDMMSIHPEARQSVHFAALHEQRINFPLDLATSGKEVLYPGMHSDVGGGYSPGGQGKDFVSGAANGTAKLAQIPLIDMHHEAVKAGVIMKTIEELGAQPVLAMHFGCHSQLIRDYNAWLTGHGVPGGAHTQQIAGHCRQYVAWKGKRLPNGPQSVLQQPFFKQSDAEDQVDLANAQRDFANLVGKLRRGKEEMAAYRRQLDESQKRMEAGRKIGRPVFEPTPRASQAAYDYAGIPAETSTLLNLVLDGAPVPDVSTVLFDNYMHDSLAGFYIGKWTELNIPAVNTYGYLRYREVFSVAGRRAQECRDPATLPPANIPTIGGAFQQLGSAMGG
ncbi:TPA: T6SS phospholipase effector Tle1-like catalytic domain-containing protein [Stenotrophomonas maltophilia]